MHSSSGALQDGNIIQTFITVFQNCLFYYVATRSTMSAPTFTELRSCSLFVDAKLRSTDGTEWDIHKIVLSRVGRFFFSAFTHPTFSGVLDLDANSDIVKCIIDFSYEGDHFSGFLIYLLWGVEELPSTGCFISLRPKYVTKTDVGTSPMNSLLSQDRVLRMVLKKRIAFFT